MTALDSFRPRNERAARRVVFALTVVAGGVTLVFTALLPSTVAPGAVTLTVSACVLILLLATWIAVAAAPPLPLWAAYPFFAVGLIVLLDLATKDASVTAQIYFFFPVLYAGAQLRRRAATAVCVAAVLAVFSVTLSLLPDTTAILDASFVGSALSAATVLLVLAGEQNDRLIARLEHHAAVDPLTGLLTRRVLDGAVRAAVHAVDSTAGTALLLIDLDRFKPINDVHGHPAGDAVLRELAALLTRVNRRNDVISRIGGDELAVLLTDCPLDAALARAEQILLEVRAHTFDVSSCSMATDKAADPHLNLSVSIGVAHLPARIRMLDTLYSAADASLYQAKMDGRDRVGAPIPPRSPISTS
jgi:diguanylate cyclase (GGDEF)-like protein